MYNLLVRTSSFGRRINDRYILCIFLVMIRGKETSRGSIINHTLIFIDNCTMTTLVTCSQLRVAIN